MALRADEYPNVLYLSREDDRVIRYLKGETIDLRDEESVERLGFDLRRQLSARLWKGSRRISEK